MNQPLILLHGALGSQAQFKHLKQLLSNHFSVYTMNFSGHGGKPATGPFSMESFADEVVQLMEQEQYDLVSILIGVNNQYQGKGGTDTGNRLFSTI